MVFLFFKLKLKMDLVILFDELLNFLHHELFFISENLLSVLQFTLYFIFEIEFCVFFVSFNAFIIQLSDFSLSFKILVKYLTQNLLLSFFRLLQDLILVIVPLFIDIHFQFKVDPFLFLMSSRQVGQFVSFALQRS